MTASHIHLHFPQLVTGTIRERSIGGDSYLGIYEIRAGLRAVIAKKKKKRGTTGAPGGRAGRSDPLALVANGHW